MPLTRPTIPTVEVDFKYGFYKEMNHHQGKLISLLMFLGKCEIFLKATDKQGFMRHIENNGNKINYLLK